MRTLNSDGKQVLVLVQARMGSSRLPGKVMMDLGDRLVLDWVLSASKRIPGVTKLAVATSDTVEDNPIAKWCADSNMACHRGSLDDVLGRFVLAAEAEGIADDDLVMRLTGDCPLLDPDVCGMVLRLQRETNADYASNVDPQSWPDGLDCEIFRGAALFAAGREAHLASDREHVGPYIRRHRHRFRAANLTCPLPRLASERWTLDTEEDSNFLRRVFARLSTDGGYGFLDVLGVLDAEPEIRELNSAEKDQGIQRRNRSRSNLGADRGFETSQRMLVRALQTIPLGSQTFSKSHAQYPKEHAPLFLTHGEGGHVFDVDGNEYIDMVCGLLSVSLGYRDRDVDEAIQAQLNNGISFSLATELEAQLAEQLVELIPAAEMIRFGKNGSDATSAAIRLARAATGRDRIAICGYHGWHDWYIGTTTRDKGVPNAVRELTHAFPYNDITALDRLFREHPDSIAAVVIEPMTVEEPKSGYLEELAALTRRRGAVLVFDEMITGFRFDLGGAQRLFGVTPDLACFGKGMANGMPLSALVGRAPIMSQVEDIFFSGTFGGETLSLAAAIATIDKMRREPVIEGLWRTGRALADGVRARLGAHGLADIISLKGKDPWTILVFEDFEGVRRETIKTMLSVEMLAAGVLTTGSHNICYAHSSADVDQVIDAYDRALGSIRQAMERGTIETDLPCPVITPVFQVRT